jgi:hypothetical protein
VDHDGRERSSGQAHDDRDAERGGPLPRPAAGDTDSVTVSAAIMVDLPATAILAPGDPAGGCRPSSGTRQNWQF